MSTVQQFDSSVNLLQALLWQYESAEKLKALAYAKQAWVNQNQKEFWDNWYRDVFNLDTANSFGLSVWSRILNMPITASLEPSKLPAPVWGFGEFRSNFNNGNFGRVDASTLPLTNDQVRLLLKLRYYQLTCVPTVTNINEMLYRLFGSQGKAYVLNPGGMQDIIYVFKFDPGSRVLFMLEYFDVLPRPATLGVQIKVVTRPIFGFGKFYKNFNNGNFGGGV